MERNDKNGEESDERVYRTAKDRPSGLRGAGLILILNQETHTEEPLFL